jgi:hypothetical protein
MQSSSGSAFSSRAAFAALLAVSCGGTAGSLPDAPVVDGEAPDGMPSLVDDGGVADGDEVLPARMCNWMLPPICPEAGAPSYANVIAPIVAKRCVPACHEPGGVSLNKPLTNHAQIFSVRATVLNQIYYCKMPPVERPPLPSDEGQLLLTWLICGSPNN